MKSYPTAHHYLFVFVIDDSYSAEPTFLQTLKPRYDIVNDLSSQQHPLSTARVIQRTTRTKPFEYFCLISYDSYTSLELEIVVESSRRFKISPIASPAILLFLKLIFMCDK